MSAQWVGTGEGGPVYKDNARKGKIGQTRLDPEGPQKPHWETHSRAVTSGLYFAGLS